MDLKEFFKKNGWYANRTKPFWQLKQAQLNCDLYNALEAYSYDKPKIKFLLWCITKWIDHRKGVFPDVVIGFLKAFGISTIEGMLDFDIDTIDKTKLLNFIDDFFVGTKSLKTVTALQIRTAIQASDFIFEDDATWNALYSNYQLITEKMFDEIRKKTPFYFLYRIVADPAEKSLAELFKEYLILKNLGDLTVGVCTYNIYNGVSVLLKTLMLNIIGFGNSSILLYDPDRDLLFEPGEIVLKLDAVASEKIQRVEI